MNDTLKSFLLAVCFGTAMGAFAQDLNYASAPQQALGYTLGDTLASIEATLKSSQTDFREHPSTLTAPSMVLEIPRQSVMGLDEVTLELSFAKGTLYQVGARLRYQKADLDRLKDSLVKQYGPVRSRDGGYHFLWFFNQGTVQAEQQRPDFAVILANDPVTDKTIQLIYADNLRRDQILGKAQVAPAATVGGPAAPAAPAPAAPAPATPGTQATKP